jgi:hypothetical protein
MDIYCPVCAEPIDNDELHAVAEEQERTYTEVAADFRKRGCRALSENAKWCVPTDPEQRAAIAIVYELSGDDMDGAASDFDDFFS